MVGTVAFSTTERISPLPPRGMSRSTYSFIRISSVAVSRDVSSAMASTSLSMPASASARLRTETIARFEWMASLPPRSTAALPLFTQSAAASAVTFGRDS